MVQQSSQPERPTAQVQKFAEEPPEPKKSGSGLLQYIIPIGISVIVAYLLIGYIGVSKGDFTTNITSMNNKLDGTIKTVNSIADKTNTMVLPADITALQTSLKTVQSSITGFAPNGDVATLRTDVNGLKSSVASLQAVPKVDTSTFATKSDLQALTDKDTAASAAIKALQTTNDATTKALTDANAKVATLTQNVTDLQNTVKTLQTTTPTPTPTPTPTGTGTTVGAIAATIIPNSFTGMSSMTLPPTPAGLVSTGTFTIQITNSSSKPLSGVQVAVGLGLFDNTNPNSPVPFNVPASGVTVSMTTNGNLSMIWTTQTTGVGYILGYINQANTGTFAFGNLTVPPGVFSYTQTFMLAVAPPPSTVTVPALIIQPSVKVISQGQ